MKKTTLLTAALLLAATPALPQVQENLDLEAQRVTH